MLSEPVSRKMLREIVSHKNAERACWLQKMLKEPAGHKMLREPAGRKMLREPAGRKMLREPIGCKMLSEPVGRKTKNDKQQSKSGK